MSNTNNTNNTNNIYNGHLISFDEKKNEVVDKFELLTEEYKKMLNTDQLISDEITNEDINNKISTNIINNIKDINQYFQIKMNNIKKNNETIDMLSTMEDLLNEYLISLRNKKNLHKKIEELFSLNDKDLAGDNFNNITNMNFNISKII
jgi:hypothetical protein